MRVKAPVEKNFKRAAKTPGKRKPGRRWISWRVVRACCALVLILYAGYRASALVAGAPLLRVTRIAVHGNVRLSTGEVEQLAHGLYGTNILLANLDRYRRALLASPWVADVALRRVLPSTVEILIAEREPFGICRLGTTPYLIDREGTLIDEFGPQYAEFDLPLVEGVVGAPRDGRPTIDHERAALAARVADAIRGHRDLGQRVSQIDVHDLHDAVVTLDGDPALLHLGEERFRERLEAYTAIASALRERVADIDYVDLRFEERLYVKPRTGGRGRAALPAGTAGRLQ
ncbi:MAG TPA: FtsQ-type POTRA domain-containing protein [Vicinamibacterales bacterium]|nr:FtsQ-type POTRA domain-containing protein [Vicinamibacterales bacterium]